jgi:hypothetical protein
LVRSSLFLSLFALGQDAFKFISSHPRNMAAIRQIDTLRQFSPLPHQLPALLFQGCHCFSSTFFAIFLRRVSSSSIWQLTQISAVLILGLDNPKLPQGAGSSTSSKMQRI